MQHPWLKFHRMIWRKLFTQQDSIVQKPDLFAPVLLLLWQTIKGKFQKRWRLSTNWLGLAGKLQMWF
jgi:hypothetical protein